MLKDFRVQKIWAFKDGVSIYANITNSLCKICSRNETFIASDPSRMERRKPGAISQSTLWFFRIIYVLGVLLLQKFCTKCPWNGATLHVKICWYCKTPWLNIELDFQLPPSSSNCSLIFFSFKECKLSFSYPSSDWQMSSGFKSYDFLKTWSS